VTDYAIKPVGWRFTDSDGAERIKTRWEFNAFVTQEGAESAALALGRTGSEWFIWRLEDGSYDHTAVENPTTPGHPAELVERFTISGYGKHRRAVPSAWHPGDRVIVRLPDRSLPRGQGLSIRQADVHGAVRAVDDGGVHVDLDREVNGVRTCYATHRELRPEARRCLTPPLP